MVSIRVLRSIGPGYAQDYITKFGFDPKTASNLSDARAWRR